MIETGAVEIYSHFEVEMKRMHFHMGQNSNTPMDFAIARWGNVDE
jgi:hypothetical protein